jgi:hypothetical protein
VTVDGRAGRTAAEVASGNLEIALSVEAAPSAAISSPSMFLWSSGRAYHGVDGWAWCVWCRLLLRYINDITGPALTTADRVPTGTAQCSTNERSSVND